VNALYPIGQTLVNVTNSYDKANIEPEMLELAKFAKHHIPEDHEKVRLLGRRVVKGCVCVCIVSVCVCVRRVSYVCGV
jgi:hypothetical protein